MLAFVDVLAEEYRDDGIRANAILPSVIDTPANRRSMPDADFDRWVTPEQIAERRALPVRGRIAASSAARTCRSTAGLDGCAAGRRAA